LGRSGGTWYRQDLGTGWNPNGLIQIEEATKRLVAVGLPVRESKMTRFGG